MTKASDNLFPKVLLDMQTSDPTAPTDADWKLYSKPGGIYARSSNAVVGPFGTGGGGDVASDAIWDAAGDLAVGSGANTAARLAIGNAGGAVSRVNGAVAWNSGTAFPTAATGDRYWRTDLGMEFYYDGSRWVTVHEYAQASVGTDVTGTTAAAPTLGYLAIPSSDIYMTVIDLSTYIAATNNGSNYWTFTANKVDSANANTSLGSVNTSGDSATTWVKHPITVNAVVAAASFWSCRINSAKTAGSPGAPSWAVTFRYRLVAT